MNPNIYPVGIYFDFADRYNGGAMHFTRQATSEIQSQNDTIPAMQNKKTYPVCMSAHRIGDIGKNIYM